MKKFTNLILTSLVLLGLGYVLWLGVHKQIEKAEAEEAAPAADEAGPEAFVVMLDKKQANALGLEKEQPDKTTQSAKCMAFGSVMDPSTLVTLDGELASAEAALKASQAENERTQALLANSDASKKAADASEAAFHADRIKLDTLVRNAQLQWGPLVSADATQRSNFVDELVAGRSSLLRVDLMPGDALADMPKSANVVVLGREEQPFVTTEILPATSTDTKTQAQGFLLRAKAPFSLRPGMALTAWLELPVPPRPGFTVPRSAVLRHDGRTWVYVQEEAEKYVRTPVTLDAPLPGDAGWFVLEAGGIGAEDVIVVVGAASLLSEELKAQGGGGGGEPD